MPRGGYREQGLSEEARPAMRTTLSNPTFADTTLAVEPEILRRQIDGQAWKSPAPSMSFSLDAVWVDGTIVANNPVSGVDPMGLYDEVSFRAGLKVELGTCQFGTISGPKFNKGPEGSQMWSRAWGVL